MNTNRKSTSLVFKTSKVFNNQHLFVTISLDDECKNGHQDFAITADVYEVNKPKTDKYLIGCGCMHDDILNAFPEFKIFIDLHLCDYLGTPMYAVANGFYNLTNGFNNAPADSDKFKDEFCAYYRITPSQFDVLKDAKNKVQYYNTLISLDIPKQWKEQADKAIKELEALTGDTFVVDSVKTSMDAPALEQIAEEEQRQLNGYYTKEAEAARQQAFISAELSKLEASRDANIKKVTLEFDLKRQVLRIGGVKALKNCIFYNHTKQLAFNWAGYGNLPESDILKIISKLNLPDGVTTKIGK